MKENNYNNLIYDIYKYFDNDKYYEITELGKSYMKTLINSSYGIWTSKESVPEKRSKKIKTLLDGTT